jgi:uncharacterized protein (TIGR02246 family)
MRQFAIFGGILMLLGLLVAESPQQASAQDSAAAKAAGNSTAATPTQQAGRPEEEKAIRQIVEQFVKAYNAGDAPAAAKLFAPDAEIVDKEGLSMQGRGPLQDIFAAIFREHPKTHIAIETRSIRFVGAAAAIADGMNTVVHAPGESPLRSRCELVCLKQDGRWQIGSARDFPDEQLDGDEQLKQLEWMVGEWVDESPESLIVTNYRWTDSRQFLVGDFEMRIKGRPAMSGSQRIGWDPAEQKLRSWVFDTEGGFGQGLWTRDGNRWIVKMTGVNREGKTASATNVTTMLGKDRMTWQSRDRVVGDEVLPDTGEIHVVRKPPQPK